MNFRHSKVANFNNIIRSHHDIQTFEISVNNFLVVEKSYT